MSVGRENGTDIPRRGCNMYKDKSHANPYTAQRMTKCPVYLGCRVFKRW